MLQRDTYSSAIINTDVQALNKYKAERALYRKVESLTKDLVKMKETVARLTERLDQLEKN